MPQFDLNLLTHLAALVETRSVTEAARRLGISQPAMSRSLARLRALVGDPLLVRTRGGMLPTRRAEELVEPLREWLAAADRLVASPWLDPAGLERRFRIVASDHGVRTVVGPALAQIRAAAPGAALDILPPGGDAQARLASGDADLLVTEVEPDRRLVHERLVLSEPYLCLARAGHPLRGGRGSVAELMLWPHVGVRGEGRSADPLTGALLAHGLEHKLVATFPYQAAAADLLATTDAIMLLPEASALEAARDPRLAAFAAPDGLPRFEQWLAWHNRNHRDPAIAWLVEMLAAGCARPERGDAFAMPLAAE